MCTLSARCPLQWRCYGGPNRRSKKVNTDKRIPGLAVSNQSDIPTAGTQTPKGKAIPTMSAQEQTTPTAEARVVLQPLKAIKANKSTEEGKDQTAEETETRPVPELKVQACETEERMLVYCLDPRKKINKE
jgi:hypothetical protein